MRYRVQDILLVSSLYDAYMLTADGQLDELILSEFLEFNIRHTPGLTHVATGREALELALAHSRYNLIITSMYVGDMNALVLARSVKQAGLSTPVILLAYDNRELNDFLERYDTSDIDRVFLWQGDVSILLAIVNFVEDRLNVAHDTGELGVQALIVIEDNTRFYSSFLPVIYRELMHHSHRLAPEGVNLSHRLLRMHARPKVLLCRTFEEAWQYFSTYQENILGVISDIEFPKDGRLDAQAGVAFARTVRELQPDVPVMLQSSLAENDALARSVGAAFLLKESPLLLHQLRQFMVEQFGFGDFVFRLPDGTAVDRASDLKMLEEKLRTVPDRSVAYHAERNHFSKWLKARTEFELAHDLRPRKVSDFATVGDLRRHLVDSIQVYRQRRDRSIVADFNRGTFDATSSLYRMGGGSLGGKARGLAFVNLLLNDYGIRQRFPGVEVAVPPCVVIGTDVFDEFLDSNDLRDFAIESRDELELQRRFLQAPFPTRARQDLVSFLDTIQYPLAVRSSSLLEDSQYQPFAGIYDTYMLPNNHPEASVRLEQLLRAIKRVYASTFTDRAKAYLENTPYRLEEEKMAVILQKLVGSRHGSRFYPDCAGVARSHNFYPVGPMAPDDGVAAMALGLGTAVVNGEVCVRFCPRFPRHVLQFSSDRDALQNSQVRFYALELDADRRDEGPYGSALRQYGLEVAEADGTLALVGSTYSAENETVYDGISRPGARLVTFAAILKHRVFPLADILDVLLDLGVQGTSSPVELEFAVNLRSTPPGARGEFAFLQLRPLALSRELAELDLGAFDPSRVLCRSTSVLGHGKLEDLRDIVVVDVHRFDRWRSQEVARDVARFNAELVAARLPYLLIGVGRWGSREPFLGIPVGWHQIAGARVIIEAGFRDMKVSPSQGSHFFQNLSSSNVGYFTVNPQAGDGFVDWEWLAAQPSAVETAYVRHVRLRDPLVIQMNGKKNEGVILKPAERGRREVEQSKVGVI
ncbi:MAG: histidine kinase [Acidobacteria bacterium]|nr:histidine kinase [Acidobacteriota bacterium]